MNCIIIWERKAIEFKRLPIKDNKVEVSKQWKPSFTLDDFLPEVVGKRFFQFWKRAKFGGKCLLLREGYPNAVNPKGLQFDQYWTEAEAKKQVGKMVAQSLEEAQPIKMWQFIILMILGSASLAILLFLVTRVFR